jgi:hypothetical protein
MRAFSRPEAMASSAAARSFGEVVPVPVANQPRVRVLVSAVFLGEMWFC